MKTAPEVVQWEDCVYQTTIMKECQIILRVIDHTIEHMFKDSLKCQDDVLLASTTDGESCNKFVSFHLIVVTFENPMMVQVLNVVFWLSHCTFNVWLATSSYLC